MYPYPKGNSKMGRIASVSLPAGVTCNPSAPCYKACYARRLAARRQNVRGRLRKKLGNLPDASGYLQASDQSRCCNAAVFSLPCFRDIPDMDYLRMMVEVARELPFTSFMVFTKQYRLVNEWISENGPLPQNLQILFSVWRNFDCSNPYNLPEAHVAYRDGFHTARPDAFHCHKNCTECCLMGEGCWNLKPGEQVEIDEH